MYSPIQNVENNFFGELTLFLLDDGAWKHYFGENCLIAEKFFAEHVP